MCFSITHIAPITYGVLCPLYAKFRLVSVKTVLYNNVSVNLKPGEHFLRVGGTIHAGDTIGPRTQVAANDARIDRRALPAPAQNIDGKLYVPAVEFMRLFGKTVTVE